MLYFATDCRRDVFLYFDTVGAKGPGTGIRVSVHTGADGCEWSSKFEALHVVCMQITDSGTMLPCYVM